MNEVWYTDLEIPQNKTEGNGSENWEISFAFRIALQ